MKVTFYVLLKTGEYRIHEARWLEALPRKGEAVALVDCDSDINGVHLVERVRWEHNGKHEETKVRVYLAPI